MIDFRKIDEDIGYKRSDLVEILNLDRKTIDKIFKDPYLPVKTILKTKYVLGKDLLEYLNKPKQTRVVKNRINTLII